MYVVFGAVLAGILAITVAGTVEPGLGPVACFQRVKELNGVGTPMGLQLCSGALNAAPAECFAHARSTGGLGDPLALEACRQATSMEPAECIDELHETTDQSDDYIAAYCAQQPWMPVFPAEAGAPECLAVAENRVSLTQERALRLCRGSASASPVACYDAGRDLLNLDDNDVVTLCARTEYVVTRTP